MPLLTCPDTSQAFCSAVHEAKSDGLLCSLVELRQYSPSSDIGGIPGEERGAGWIKVSEYREGEVSWAFSCVMWSKQAGVHTQEAFFLGASAEWPWKPSNGERNASSRLSCAGMKLGRARGTSEGSGLSPSGVKRNPTNSTTGTEKIHFPHSV